MERHDLAQIDLKSCHSREEASHNSHLLRLPQVRLRQHRVGVRRQTTIVHVAGSPGGTARRCLRCRLAQPWQPNIVRDEASPLSRPPGRSRALGSRSRLASLPVARDARHVAPHALVGEES